MITTLNKIKEYSPCRGSWVKLLDSLNKTKADNEPIELKYILDTLGLDDAVWSLRSIDANRDVRLFACDCAESVLHIFEESYPNDKRPRKTIEVSRLFADGKATREELHIASAYAYAASAAAFDAAASAAAFDAVSASADAASAAAFDAASAAASAAVSYAYGAERVKQKELFIKYFCND